jgi:hypothetical protein
VKDNKELYKCRNCSGNHSAAYRGCPKYREVEQVLKIQATNNKSYVDATKQFKLEKKLNEQNQPESNILHPSKEMQQKQEERIHATESSFFKNSKLTPIKVSPMQSTPDRERKPSVRKNTVPQAIEEVASICGHLVYHLLLIAKEINYRKITDLSNLAVRIDEISENIYGNNFTRTIRKKPGNRGKDKAENNTQNS